MRNDADEQQKTKTRRRMVFAILHTRGLHFYGISCMRFLAMGWCVLGDDSYIVIMIAMLFALEEKGSGGDGDKLWSQVRCACTSLSFL